MVIIIGQCSVNLGHRQVRMLEVISSVTPPIREFVKDDFDDFHVRIVDPRHPLSSR